ncbi:MAG: major capsid protein, partial [Planctomycetota bacterium]
MATTFDITNAVDGSAVDNFLPEIWEAEIVAAYKSALVMANLCKKMNHKGKPGDRINVQRPDRNTASSKAENNFVTLQTHTDTQVNIDLTSHWEYSVLLEDVAELQSISSLRSIYTEDAGYALAKKVDSDLHAEAATAGGGTAYSKAVVGADGSTNWSDASSGNGSAIADAGIRRVIQTFEDKDVPSADRFLVIPPVAANTMRGLARYTEQAYTGEVGAGNTIRNGRIGNVYGVEVFT